VAKRRRRLFAILVIASTALATYLMSLIIYFRSGALLGYLMLFAFAVLFAWISVGFWTALVGFISVLRGVDRYAPKAKARGIKDDTRVALVFPSITKMSTASMPGSKRLIVPLSERAS